MKMKKILKWGLLAAIVTIILLNLTDIFSFGIKYNEKTGIGKDLAKTAEYVVTGVPSDNNTKKKEDSNNTLLNTLRQINDEAENPNNMFIDEGNIKVTFIAVGQGDCILIEDNGRAMLIDAGPDGSYKAIESTLAEKGINQIDVMVLTHPDLDHIGSASLLLSHYNIPTVYMPNIEGRSAEYTRLMSAMEKRKTEIINPVCGQPIPFGMASYAIYCKNKEVINSYEENENLNKVAKEYNDLLNSLESTYSITEDDINSYSLIVKAINGEDSFLLTGDATGEEIDKILEDGFDLSADVLKAAHHGSANCGCNSESFLKVVNPESFVISCGEGNQYGHPHIETMELAQNMSLDVYRTDIQGTISFISSGSGIKCTVEPTNDYRNGNSM